MVPSELFTSGHFFNKKYFVLCQVRRGLCKVTFFLDTLALFHFYLEKNTNTKKTQPKPKQEFPLFCHQISDPLLFCPC